MPKSEKTNLEPFIYRDVPAEQCWAVKHVDRPHAAYEFPGLSMRVLVERWENGGAKELCCAVMEPGFTAEWVKYPKLRELFYVRSGKIKFNVMGDEFIADDECVVSIPRFAPHSLEALERSQVFDLGGQTKWSLFLQNYESIRRRDPARLAKPETVAMLKSQFDCPIRAIGMK